jgi:hypothetical protein
LGQSAPCTICCTTSRAPKNAIQTAVFGITLLLTVLLALPVWAQSIDDSRGGAIELGGSNGPTDTPRTGSVRSSQSSGQSLTQPEPSNGRPPKVGRKAAEKYLSPSPDQGNPQTESRHDSGDAPHFLAVHIGTYVSDTAYRWGSPDVQNNVGKWTFGLSYKVGEWVNSMDLLMRVDLSSYTLNEGSATKISFLPLITFPDVTSRFPLYFGVGAGLGVFAVQFGGKSPLSLDYQVVAGARFFDVFKNTGFFVEAGLKNHFMLLSDGQFNGTFVSVGSVFLF